MSRNAIIAEFVSFCIESCAQKWQISGVDVAAVFSRFGVFDYLVRGYEVLHSMGGEWLVDDIGDFLHRRGYAA